jgi:hypothetical protein
MTDRIDLDDPLIIMVSQPEFDEIAAAYAHIGGEVGDMGDGIKLIEVQHNVVARFRISRPQ